MRRLLIILLLIAILVNLSGCGPKKILYKTGTYEGTGQGHHGPIKVQITTDSYEIKEIVITEQQEIPVLSDIVYEKIPVRVKKVNHADVKVVSGATFTSNGLIEAIQNALKKAKIETE